LGVRIVRPSLLFVVLFLFSCRARAMFRPSLFCVGVFKMLFDFLKKIGCVLESDVFSLFLGAVLFVILVIMYYSIYGI
jgi:hypothetical protein